MAKEIDPIQNQLKLLRNLCISPFLGLAKAEDFNSYASESPLYPRLGGLIFKVRSRFDSYRVLSQTIDHPSQNDGTRALPVWIDTAEHLTSPMDADRPNRLGGRVKADPVGEDRMDKASNLILAAFSFYLFVTGIAYCNMNKWIVGIPCLLIGLICIISIYILDKRREKREEIKQDEINKVRIDQLIEEFSRSDDYVLKINIGSKEMLLNRIGFTPAKSEFMFRANFVATTDFVAWSEVSKISTSKEGGDSKSEPTPYYMLSILLANNKLIWTKFKKASEHAKVVEAISQWLWKRQTMKDCKPLAEIR